MVGAVVSATTEGPWAIAGACAAIAVLVITLGQIFVSMRRQHFLNRPCRALFVVGGHATTSLSVKSHSRFRIQVELMPRITQSSNGISFFCVGAKIENDSSITEASSVQTDRRGAANYFGPFQLGKDIPELFGFWITAGNPGKYALIIHVFGDDTLGKIKSLILHVEETPRAKKKCILHKDCMVDPI